MMDTDAVFLVLMKIGLVIGLVLLNGFFVAAEFSIVKIRDTQLETLVLKGHRRAQIARRVIRNLDASLSATQLGITLASLGLGWFAEPVFASLLEHPLDWLQVESEHMKHSISFAVGFSTITFLHIVAGELAPKSLAIQYPLPTTLWVARPLLWFHRASYPFIWALNNASNLLLKQFGVEPVSESEMVHSEEELRLLIGSSQEHHGGSALGRDIVLNALDLRNRIARDVMKPRRNIVYLDPQSSLQDALKIAETSRFSRFPVCQSNDLDKTLGVVHFKDLYANRDKASKVGDLSKSLRQLIYVPETARLEKTLELFLGEKLHFAIVVDEYGTTVGMVTLENILEELVGQIQDEFDQESPMCVQSDSETWDIDGYLPLHELSELVEEDLEEEDIATVSGWVTHKLGGFPKVGEVVELECFKLHVKAMEGPRVSRLTLRRKPDPQDKASGAQSG